MNRTVAWHKPVLAVGGTILFILLVHFLASATSPTYATALDSVTSTWTDHLTKTVKADAAIVVLARNSELHGILQSMTSLEDRFNKQYAYDYVFLNDEPFSNDFKTRTQAITGSKCQYGLIPKQDWEEPEWINQTRAEEVRKTATYFYGDSQSYRRMCRFQSGRFFQHDLLKSYKWYWRLEPNVKFFCNVVNDPFKYLESHNKTYGWTVAIRELPETIPTLWETTKEFIKQHPEHVPPHNAMQFLSDDAGDTYNTCHFWSNFEIGSLDWLRSEAYQAYFDHLDRAGGFFYERWGDAPVHSIAAALLQDRDRLHWFTDFGYQHDNTKWCPENASQRACSCDPTLSYTVHSHECTDRYMQLVGT